MPERTLFLRLALLTFLLSFAGCSTLASLGLPFGSSRNEILRSAKTISQAPGQSLMLPTEMTKQPLDIYIIEIGDTLLLETVSFDATIRLPGDQVVKPDGTVSLGECGQIQVMNKTVEQVRLEAQTKVDDYLRRDLEIQFEAEKRQRDLEAQIGAREGEGDDVESNSEFNMPLGDEPEEEDKIALERRIAERISKNEISARLVSWESKRIYVLGEVNSPGSFTLIGNETVLDAIIEAGGMTAKANQHQINVARPSHCGECRTVMQVCYEQIVQLGDTSTNYQLRPGDRVFVPSLTFADDLKKSLRIGRTGQCPRCAGCPQGCNLPQGCQCK